MKPVWKRILSAAEGSIGIGKMIMQSGENLNFFAAGQCYATMPLASLGLRPPLEK
jgi:hypothetical protein